MPLTDTPATRKYNKRLAKALWVRAEYGHKISLAEAFALVDKQASANTARWRANLSPQQQAAERVTATARQRKLRAKETPEQHKARLRKQREAYHKQKGGLK